MSASFVAGARLHIVDSSCRFSGMLPALKLHADRPGFDRRDRSSHECRLMRDVARMLLGAEEVKASLRYVRATTLLPPSSRPNHLSERSEALRHVSADAKPCCVLPATAWLLVCTHLGASRVPSPAASIGPSPLHLGGCLESAGWLGGGEARSFEDGDAHCVPRLTIQRQFAACLQDAQRVARRRYSAFPG